MSQSENRRLELSALSKSHAKVYECVDNDETASLVACLVHAETLLILTSVDGIYTDQMCIRDRFISVSPDRGAAIAVIAAEKRTNVPPPRVAFKGLNPAYVYEVTARRQENYENNLSFTAGGDVLMCGELFFPDFYDDASARENSGCMYTRMFLVKKQKSS